MAEDAQDSATDPPTEPVAPPTASTAPPLLPTALPSGVADVPRSPRAQEQFFAVHSEMVKLGAEPMPGVEQLEQAVVDGEERDVRMLGELTVEEGWLAAEDGEAAAADVLPREDGGASVQVSQAGSTPDEVLEAQMEPLPALADVPEKREDLAEADVAGGLAAPVLADRTDSAEDKEDDLDGEPIEVVDEEDEQDGAVEALEPLPSAVASSTELVDGASAVAAEPVTRPASAASTPAEGSQGGESANTRLLAGFWRDSVSRVYPPRYWLHQDPPPPVTADPPVLALSPRPIGCTLTLRLPDASERVFSLPNSAGITNRKAAKNAAAGLALAALDVLEEAKKLRAELGPEDEAAEQEKQKAGKAEWEVVDKPYELLVQKAQKCMMGGEMKWAFETDELNITHGCTLHVPVLLSDVRSYTVQPLFPSHREAKDAAARLALKDGVPQLWEAAYRERLKKDSGGYITFAASGDTPREVEGQGEGEKQGEAVEPIALLNKEVKAAFGGVSRWISWEHQAVPQPSSNGKVAQPLLSATLTLAFPPTTLYPDPPAPLAYSVSARYHTKHHAYTACALSAFKGGVVDKLKPYREERRAELEGKKAERAREKKEKNEKPLPRAGTVPWEALQELDNPAAYLNLCAQQWTSNGSPLKFDFVVEQGKGTGKSAKHHGCSLSVYINPTLTKVYTVHPSAATPHRRGAKEAAVRLAFRERVLDLMMPSDFDPGAAMTGPSKTAAKKAEKAAGKGDKGKGSAATLPMPPRSAPPSMQRLNGGEQRGPMQQARTAVAYLDQACHEWLGPGFVPAYDVRQNQSGFFGAVLRIRLPPPPAHLPPREPKTYYVDFAHPSRASAEEAVATLAARDGVMEQIQREVPPIESAGAAQKGGATFGRGGRGLGPFGAGQPPAKGGLGEPSLLPQQSGVVWPVLPARPADPQGAGAGIKRGAASALALESLVAPPPKKQRVWGAPAAAADGTSPRANEGLAHEGVERAAGQESEEAVSNLLAGVRTKLGNEPSASPRYEIVENGALFGSAVTVPLSSSSTNSRTFRVAATHPSRSSARNAAAQAALAAGVLDLLESRQRVPVLPSSGKQRGNEIEKTQRTPVKQKQASRAAYGGLGAAAGKLAPAASSPAPKQPVAVLSRPASKAGVASGAAVKGKQVGALEAYCTSHDLPAPAWTRSKDGGKERLWVVVKDLRFELPTVPADSGEEKLAAKVLKHLQKLAAAGEAQKIA